jgi:hypothetical protein
MAARRTGRKIRKYDEEEEDQETIRRRRSGGPPGSKHEG